MSEDTAIVVSTQSMYLAPAAKLNTILDAYNAKAEFIKQVLHQDTDYGIVPGSSKPTLLKPGAEKLASFFGLRPTFEDVTVIEDWTGKDHGGEVLIYYREKCKLWLGDHLIASADGSCNSWEKKYRYRQADRTCPNCGKPTVFKSKKDGGWFCWSKKGGCGAQFPAGDERITKQETGQVPNPDMPELVNTILKMAQKRALVAATLIATNASEYFTQDVEDMGGYETVEAEYTEAKTKPAEKAQSKPAPEQARAAMGFESSQPYAPEEYLVKAMTAKDAALIEWRAKDGSLTAMGNFTPEQLDKIHKYFQSLKRELTATETVQWKACATLIAATNPEE